MIGHEDDPSRTESLEQVLDALISVPLGDSPRFGVRDFLEVLLLGHQSFEISCCQTASAASSPRPL